MYKIFAVVLLACLILPYASAASCTNDYTIFRISGTTNAHAEVYNGSGSYDEDICWPNALGSNRDCDDSWENSVLKLSTLTNAHVQEKGELGYPTDTCSGDACDPYHVCFGDIRCYYERTAGQSCDTGDGYTCIATISAQTNAHVSELCSGVGSYDTKICCREQPTCEITSINPTEIDEGDSTTVNISVSNFVGDAGLNFITCDGGATPGVLSSCSSGTCNLTCGTYDTAGSYAIHQLELEDEGTTEIISCTGNFALVVEGAPTARAGRPYEIVLGDDTVDLDGSYSTDPEDCTPPLPPEGEDCSPDLDYFWYITDNDASCSPTSPTGARPTTICDQVGTSQVRLRVRDTDYYEHNDYTTITVLGPPTADAGEDETITKPATQVTLNGSDSTDQEDCSNNPNCAALGYLWEIPGLNPASCSISSPTTMNPTATCTGTAGSTTTIRLTVEDSDFLTDWDEMDITINDAANQDPVAAAGPNKSTLSGVSVSITGTCDDADGTISSCNWTESSANCTITAQDPQWITPSSVTNTASVTCTGTAGQWYTITLTATDNDGATHTDTMRITIAAPANQDPVAYAGTDKPAVSEESLSITGTCTDDDGTIGICNWTSLSANCTIETNPQTPTGIGTSSATNTIDVTCTGTPGQQFTMRLTAEDNKGAIDTDDMIITIVPPGVAGCSIDSIAPNPVRIGGTITVALTYENFTNFPPTELTGTICGDAASPTGLECTSGANGTCTFKCEKYTEVGDAGFLSVVLLDGSDPINCGSSDRTIFVYGTEITLVPSNIAKGDSFESAIATVAVGESSTGDLLFAPKGKDDVAYLQPSSNVHIEVILKSLSTGQQIGTKFVSDTETIVAGTSHPFPFHSHFAVFILALPVGGYQFVVYTYGDGALQSTVTKDFYIFMPGTDPTFQVYSMEMVPETVILEEGKGSVAVNVTVGVRNLGPPATAYIDIGILGTTHPDVQSGDFTNLGYQTEYTILTFTVAEDWTPANYNVRAMAKESPSEAIHDSSFKVLTVGRKATPVPELHELMLPFIGLAVLLVIAVSSRRK